MQPTTSERSHYDAVIVGGGVTGAMVALEFARAGKSVVVLEAGTNESIDPEKYQDLVSNYYAMGAARGTPNGPYPPNLSALSPNDSSQHPYFVPTLSSKASNDF